jgi:hypothetical protein
MYLKANATFFIKISWSMLFKEIIAVYSQKHKKPHKHTHNQWVKCRVADC